MTTVTNTRFSYETASQYRLYWSSHSGPNQHPQPKAPHSVTQGPQIKPESPTSQPQPANLTSADVFKRLQSFSSQESGDILSLPGVMPSVLNEIIEELENQTNFQNFRFVHYPSYSCYESNKMLVTITESMKCCLSFTSPISATR